MKVERIVRLGQIVPPARDALRASLLAPPAGHAFENVGTGVLKRHVEIRKDLAVSHQGDDVVDMRVGIDVVQPHPDAELAEFARQIEKFRADLAVLPGAAAYLRSTP